MLLVFSLKIIGYIFLKVERIVEYANLPPEPPLETDLKSFNSNYPGRDFDKWPEKGWLNIINFT